MTAPGLLRGKGSSATRVRLLVTIIFAVVAFALLFLLIPRIKIPGTLLDETAGAILVDLLGSAVATFVFWAIYALVGHKIRGWEDSIGRKRCDACQKGRVTCPNCAGTGSRIREAAQQEQCPTCKGTAIVLAQCPRCTGSGFVSRPATYAHALGPPIVRMDFNPFHWGHYEDVSVTVTNTDEVQATFSVVVSVFEGVPSSQYATVSLPPRQSATPTFTFKVKGGGLRPVQAAVQPSTVQVRCDVCKGTGRSDAQCPECHGKGSIVVTRKLVEDCPTCLGTKTSPCSKCGGSGRVPRIP